MYYLIKNNDEEMINENKKHIAASYQETILETLIQKMIFISEKLKFTIFLYQVELLQILDLEIKLLK